MRITVSIEANELARIQQITGQRRKSPAIAKALAEYLREREKQLLIRKVLSGGINYR